MTDVKSQSVRVMDVLFLGPIMVLASTMIKDPYTKAVLAVGGVGTRQSHYWVTSKIQRCDRMIR